MSVRFLNYTLFNTALLAAVMLFSGCPSAQGDPDIPPGILNREEMASLLADFALAESAANLNINQVPVSRLDSAYAFHPLRDHGITRAQYDTSIKFYIKHPTLYKKVYERVLEKLIEMEAAREPVTP